MKPSGVTGAGPASAPREEQASGQWIALERGDTLGALSRTHGVSVARLVAANQIHDPDRIYAGRWLWVPAADHDEVPPAPPDGKWSRTTQHVEERLARVRERDRPEDPTVATARQQVDGGGRRRTTTPVTGLPPPNATGGVATAPAPGPSLTTPATTKPATTTPTTTTPATTTPATTTPIIAGAPADPATARETDSNGDAPFALMGQFVDFVAWRTLAWFGIDHEQVIELGPPLGTATLTLHDTIDREPASDEHQLAFSQAVEEGGESVAWLTSGGEARLDGAAFGFGDPDLDSDTDGEVRGDVRFAYEVTRPYTYPKNRESFGGLVKAIARNTLSLPLSHEKAEKLERGSRFELSGRLELDADAQRNLGLPVAEGRAELDAEVELSIARLEEKKVQVTLETEIELGVDVDVTGLAEDRGELEIAARHQRQMRRSFVIDLASEEGRRAYDALMRLDSNQAHRISEDSEAVTETLGTFGRGGKARLGGNLEVTPTTDIDGSLTVGTRTTDTSTTTTVSGDLGGRHTTETGTEIDGRISHGRTHEVHTETGATTDTGRTEVTAGVDTPVVPTSDTGPGTHLSVDVGSTERYTIERPADHPDVPRPTTSAGAADLPAGVRYDWEHDRRVGVGIERGPDSVGVTLADGTEIHRTAHDSEFVRTGELAMTLSTETPIGETEETAISMRIDRDRSFRLSTPLGSDENLRLPMTATDALALPAGSEFELTGEGAARLGLARERLLGVPMLSGEAAIEIGGELSIEVERLEGSLVMVEWEMSREKTAERGARYDTPPGEGTEFQPSASVSFSGERTDRTDEVGEFELDLSKADHRAAYDALLRGDPVPALKAVGKKELDTETRWDSEHTLEPRVQLFEWLEGSLTLTRRNIDPTNWRVRADEEKTAFTQRQLDEGHEVRWIESVGVLNPKISHRLTAPVGGPLTHHVGVGLETLLEYRTMWPEIDGDEKVVTPSLSWQGARELPEAASFAFRARGSITGMAGTGIGAEFGGGPVRLGASAGVEVETARAREFEVRVKRLADSRVEVEIVRLKERASGTDFAARLGLEVDSAALLDGTFSRETLEHWSQTTDKLDRKLEDLLALSFTSGFSSRDAEEKRITFELDLKKPAAQSAYESLVRLDPKDALAAADEARGGEPNGVSVTSGQITTTHDQRQHSELAIAGTKLFLIDALRRDSTRIERMPDGYKQTDRSTYDRKYHGLLGRDADMRWEAVLVRTDEVPDGQRFFRLTYTNQDPITGKHEVERLLTLAHQLEAKAAGPVKARKDDGRNIFARIAGGYGRHGDTTTEMDIFFTDAAILAMGEMDRESAIHAYGQTVATRTGKGVPGWADPDPEIAARARDLIESHENGRSGGSRDDQTNFEDDYRRLTGRELAYDKRTIDEGLAYGEMVERLEGNKDPVEWIRAFADLGRDLKFDFYDAVATINGASNSDEVVVHRMSMKGTAVDIVMTDEGLLTEPDGRPVNRVEAPRLPPRVIAPRDAEGLRRAYEAAQTASLPDIDELSGGRHELAISTILSGLGSTEAIARYRTVHDSALEGASSLSRHHRVAKLAMGSGYEPTLAVALYNRVRREGFDGASGSMKDNIAEAALLSGRAAEDAIAFYDRLVRTPLADASSQRRHEFAAIALLSDRTPQEAADFYNAIIASPLDGASAQEKHLVALTGVLSGYSSAQAIVTYNTMRRSALRGADSATKRALARLALLSERESQELALRYNAVFDGDLHGLVPTDDQRARLAQLSLVSNAGAEEMIASYNALHDRRLEDSTPGQKRELERLAALTAGAIPSNRIAALLALGVL